LAPSQDAQPEQRLILAMLKQRNGEKANVLAAGATHHSETSRLLFSQPRNRTRHHDLSLTPSHLVLNHTTQRPPSSSWTQFAMQELQQRSRLTRCAARLQHPGASSRCYRHVSPSPCPWWLGTRLSPLDCWYCDPSQRSHCHLSRNSSQTCKRCLHRYIVVHSRSELGSSSNRLHFPLILSTRYQGDVAERTLPLRRCSTAKRHWPSRL
jgi:hypothetical protein